MLVVGMGALSLCGCTVTSHGLVGISRNGDGSLSAVVQMCDGHVDSVVVYAGSGGPSSETVEQVDFPGPVMGFDAVPLSQNFESDTSEFTQLRIFAGSADNTSSADGPTFAASELRAIQGDKILSVDPENYDRSLLLAPQQFVDAANRSCL